MRDFNAFLLKSLKLAGDKWFEHPNNGVRDFYLKFLTPKNKAKIYKKSSNLPHFAPSWIFTPQFLYLTPQNEKFIYI